VDAARAQLAEAAANGKEQLLRARDDLQVLVDDAAAGVASQAQILEDAIAKLNGIADAAALAIQTVVDERQLAVDQAGARVSSVKARVEALFKDVRDCIDCVRMLLRLALHLARP